MMNFERITEEQGSYRHLEKMSTQDLAYVYQQGRSAGSARSRSFDSTN